MFVEFQSVEFNNFKSIKQGTVVLKDREVVLIQGVNNDKSGSNGAGKSTIANGLLWCLYGNTLAGKETEKEIIPKSKFVSSKEFKATGGCSVTVKVICNVKEGGVAYTIIRYRKHPEYKNTVRVLKYDADISKCTDKETNILIEDIVGADYHAFVHSNIFSFGNISPFLTLSDKDKKESILPKYFVDSFRGTYKQCSSELSDVDSSLDSVRNEVIALTYKLVEKENSKKFLEQDIDKQNKMLESVKEELSKEEDQQKLYKIKIGELITGIEQYEKDLGILQVELRGHKGKYDSVVAESTHLAELVLSQLKLDHNVSTKTLELERYKQSCNIDAQRISELEIEIVREDYLCSELIMKIIICEEQLGIWENSIAGLSETRKILSFEFNEQSSKLTAVNNEIFSLLSEKETLLLQKNKIETKYYSEACKECPSSKMKGFFTETEKTIKKVNHILVEKQQSIIKLQERLEELRCKIDEAERFRNERNNLVQSLKNEKLSVLTYEFQDVKGEISLLKKELSDLKNRHNEASDFSGTLLQMDSDLKKLKKQLKELVEQVSSIQSSEPEKRNRQILDQYTTINNKISSINKRKEATQTAFNNLRVDKRGLDEHILALKESLNVGTELEDRLKKVALELTEIEQEKSRLISQQGVLDNKFKILEFWKRGFSPTGIEGFMLDSLIDSMNTLIANYLGYLTNNTISLTLIPDSTLKTGDTRNKISDKVENEFGGATYRTNSEGEKRVMDIALMFALKYIYEQITGTTYNILFLDEAFDTLDASTCSLVINLINTLDTIDSIFVVSHNDSIALEFDSFIKMVKNNGITEVVDNDSNE